MSGSTMLRDEPLFKQLFAQFREICCGRRAKYLYLQVIILTSSISYIITIDQLSSGKRASDETLA